jgi:hypothetical protein
LVVVPEEGVVPVFGVLCGELELPGLLWDFLFFMLFVEEPVARELSMLAVVLVMVDSSESVAAGDVIIVLSMLADEPVMRESSEG